LVERQLVADVVLL